MLGFFYKWIAISSLRLRQLQGWKRAGAAFGLGLLNALAFPPTQITPLLWICFPAFIFLLRGTTTALQAFITGTCYAFGFLVLGLYWIAAAMFVDIAHFWWAVPLAVAGLPLFFSLHYGVIAIVARKIGLQNLSGILAFALLWFLADYARGHFYTGFPWIITGYAWSGCLPMLQIASVIGIYGLTLITLVCASLPALLDEENKIHAKICVLSLGILLAIGLWGTWRLHTIPPEATIDVPDVRLRLVQPNISQAHKWDQEEREANFQHLLDLTSAPANQPITHVIWPETASTFYLMEDPEHRQAIAAHLPQDGALLTGVIRRNLDENGRPHFYNSLVVVNSKARIVASYDKFHLVPFGEYIPYRTILPLRTLANMGLDFSTGDGIRSLRVAGLPSFSPLICYEAIFPGEVADPTDRPHFLVNITNDGWYGHTAGPYQHFAIVRLRAIEEGIPLVRAANTGISGVFDAYGRMTARLGLGRSGFLDANLPPVLTPTWFSRYGKITLWSLFGILVVIIIVVRKNMKVF